MRRPKKDIQLTSYDELLGLEETPEKSMNQVVEIDLAKKKKKSKKFWLI
jgi:ParB family transcriptional regulator, chromosome partitioning protein